MDTARVAQPEQWQINKPPRRAQVLVLKRASGHESTLTLFGIILINRRKVLRGALLGAVAGAILALSLPVRFKSTARLIPIGDRNFSSPPLLIGLMQSRTVRDRIVQRFNLKMVYRARLAEKARATLAQNTIFRENLSTGTINVTVTDNDAQRAAAICDAYSEELNLITSGMSRSSASDERLFLEEELKTAKSELDSTAKQLGDFSRKTALIDLEDQGGVLMGAKISLHGQLINASSELAGLEQMYADRNPQVRLVLGRRKALEEEFIGANREPGEDFDVAAPRVYRIYPTVRELPLLGVTYSDLSARIAIQQSAYEIMSQMVERARSQEIRDVPVAEILDAASVPESRSFPPRLEIIFFGALVASASRVLWLLGVEYWRAIFPKTAAEIGEEFVDVFTTVPAQEPACGATECRQ